MEEPRGKDQQSSIREPCPAPVTWVSEAERSAYVLLARLMQEAIGREAGVTDDPPDQ